MTAVGTYFSHKVKIFRQKYENFVFFGAIKKVAVAAEERLKNTFCHRERVQGV